MNDEQIVSLEELETLTKDNNILLLNDYYFNDFNFDLNSFEVFKKAMVTLRPPILFYNYTNIDIDEYLIEENDNASDSPEINPQIAKAIIKYNNDLKINFPNTPVALSLCFVIDGVIYTFSQESEFYSNLDFADDALEKLISRVIEETPEEELEKIKHQRKKETSEKIEQYKQLIFADNEFKNCTNLTYRKRYLNKFLEKNPEARYIISKSPHRHPIGFIEDIWREFKDKGLHK